MKRKREKAHFCDVLFDCLVGKNRNCQGKFRFCLDNWFEMGVGWAILALRHWHKMCDGVACGINFFCLLNEFSEASEALL